MFNNSYITGAGLDCYSNNGALLAHQNGAIFGVRIGFLKDGRYISAIMPHRIDGDPGLVYRIGQIRRQLRNSFYTHLDKTGPHATDSSYAELTALPITISWAKASCNSIVGKVTVAKENTIVVVEAYGPFDFPDDFVAGRGLITAPMKNPATFHVESPTIITGVSPHVEVEPGDLTPTGGWADLKGRSRQILASEKGLMNFKLISSREPEYARGCDFADAVEIDIEDFQHGLTKAGNKSAYMKFCLSLSDTLYIKAIIDEQPVTETTINENDIDSIISESQQNYASSRVSGTGPLADAIEPFINEEFWMQTYNPYTKRIFIPAGRTWMADLPFNVWGWDECFNALIAAVESPEIARATLLDVYKDKRLGPYCIWNLHCRHTCYDLLEKTYDYFKHACADSDLIEGMVCCGLDDTPAHRYHEAQYSPVLNALKVLNLEMCRNICRQLGKDKDANRFEELYFELKTKVNKTMWNADEGIYLNRGVSGGWNKVKTPISFYPLLAGIADEKQAQQLLQHLLDPAQFWGDFVVPSLSKDHPEYGKPGLSGTESEGYPPFDYWRGTIWAPTNYMIYHGLKRYGFDDVAAQIAAKSTSMWLDVWKKYNISPEMFNPETGEPGLLSCAKHQSWTGLLPLMGLEEMINIDIWGNSPLCAIRFGSTAIKDATTVRNLPIRGNLYDIITDTKCLTLNFNGQLVFKSQGIPVVRNFIMNEKKIEFDFKTAQPIRIELPLFRKTLSFDAGYHTVSESKQI